MNELTRPIRTGLPIAVALLLLGACQGPSKPNYSKKLPPGQWALRKVQDPAKWPDLAKSYRTRGSGLRTALDRSIRWFYAPSTRYFFPIGDVTHLRAHVSVYAFRELLESAEGPDAFDRAMHEQFQCYTSVGYDGEGTVLYTGYYTPVFEGSREKTDRYTFPLYKRPDDLVTDPKTGEPKGRRVDGGTEPYPTRRQIEEQNLLKGLELVYLPTRMDRYIIHVNGSAKINLQNGEVMYVGYDGKTDREYQGIGRALVEEGKIDSENLSLQTMRAYFRKHPDELQKYIYRNKSYVFFKKYDGENWPAGSLGLKVTPKRTLATDNDVFPRSGVTVAETTVPTRDGGQRPFNQIMVDQDTGGAIRAAGRADIYMGIGPDAAELAGYQFAEGRLYYFFLKHDRVLDWLRKMQADPDFEDRTRPEPLTETAARTEE